MGHEYAKTNPTATGDSDVDASVTTSVEDAVKLAYRHGLFDDAVALAGDDRLVREAQRLAENALPLPPDPDDPAHDPDAWHEVLEHRMG